jgi:hypothetical protein
LEKLKNAFSKLSDCGFLQSARCLVVSQPKILLPLCSELAGSETLRLNEIEKMKKKRSWKKKTALETDGSTSG